MWLANTILIIFAGLILLSFVGTWIYEFFANARDATWIAERRSEMGYDPRQNAEITVTVQEFFGAQLDAAKPLICCGQACRVEYCGEYNEQHSGPHSMYVCNVCGARIDIRGKYDPSPRQRQKPVLQAPPTPARNARLVDKL